MKNAVTYVGLDAHKKDIYVAMLVDHERVPVTWQLSANDRQTQDTRAWLQRSLEPKTPSNNNLSGRRAVNEYSELLRSHSSKDI